MKENLGASQATGLFPADWLPVTGYEGIYDVSRSGDIRSLRSGRTLAWVFDGKGYPTVKLSKGGIATRHKVHRLVCRAFHGPGPDGYDVAHLDGRRDTPNAENLTWASRSENCRHAVGHGTHRGFSSDTVSGASHPRAKLSAEEVAAIRHRISVGEKQSAIGRAYGVHRSTINDIAKGLKWKI